MRSHFLFTSAHVLLRKIHGGVLVKSLQDNGLEIWFLTGSQSLYGEETLAQVAQQSQEVVATLNAATHIRIKATWKPVLTTPESIKAICLEALVRGKRLSPLGKAAHHLQAAQRALWHLVERLWEFAGLITAQV